MAITTPARVRNRIQAAEAEISDTVLNELIADEQAFIESYAGKTFAETDTQVTCSLDLHRSMRSQSARVLISAIRRHLVYD